MMMDERRYSSWKLERLAIGEITRLRIGASTIGRHSTSVIRISDSHYVSRNHARILVSEDDQCVDIEDLNSVNGVFVNKVLYRETSARLQDGDHIGIGVIVDEDVNADPGHPVFVLRYSPILIRASVANKLRPCPLSVRRLGFGKATAVTSSSIAAKLCNASKSPNGVRSSLEEKPSTSAAAAKKYSIAPEAFITISDDEDEAENKSTKKTNSTTKSSANDAEETTGTASSVAGEKESIDSDKETKREAVDFGNEVVKDNLSDPITKSPSKSFDDLSLEKTSEQNDSKQESSKQGEQQNIARKLSTSIEIAKTSTLKEATPKTNGENSKNVDAHMEPPSTTSAPTTTTTTSILTTTTTTAHMPIMSIVKQERMRTVSADIANIFGGTDEVIMDTVKTIDPFVYKALNGTSNEQLRAGVTINLLSDEENEEIGHLLPATFTTKDSSSATEITKETSTAAESIKDKSTAIEEAKEPAEMKEASPVNTSKRIPSPNIFESSLNDSGNEDANIKSKQPDVQPNTLAAQGGDSSAYDLRNDEEEFMFSQIVLNDMKEELADENIEDCIADLEEVIDEIQLNTSTTPELEENKLVNIKQELDTSAWSIDHSDDEDFDQELETKVSDWSAKLFSQSLSAGNMSQIYDVDYDDEEDEGNDEANNDEGDKVSEAEDNNDDFNFYNGNTDKFIDELYQSLQQKVGPSETVDEEEREGEKLRDESKDSVDSASSLHRLSSISDEENLGRVDRELIEEEAQIDKEEEEEKSRKQKEEAAFEAKKNEAIREDKTAEKTKTTESKTSLQKDKKSSESVEEKTSSNLKIRKRRKSSYTDRRDKETKLEGKDPKKHRSRSRSNSLDKAASEYKATPETSPVVEEKRETTTKPSTSNLHRDKSESRDKAKVVRHPPLIIDAPQLPKYKGKCRGVSACPVSFEEKLKSARERARSESAHKELKLKWLEKPSLMKKREKEHAKHIKDIRKEQLRDLAEKQKLTAETTHKRKSKCTEDGQDATKAKRPKVKITENNRGAFLVNEAEVPPQKPFKIPKIVRVESINENATDAAKTTSPNAAQLSSPLFITTTTLFEEILSKPDFLFAKPPRSSPTEASGSIATATTTSASSTTAVSEAYSTTAVAARAKRTTNKITFASMQRNFVESHQNQKQLELFSNIRTCMTDTEKRDEVGGGGSVKTKKKVRFNDTPIIHYIERLSGATKKVDKKDILPLSTINSRRQIIRSAFPIVDCTSKIISMFLTWSNEWLEKRNIDAQGAEEVILPMSNQFSSFECYKNVLFPLMKLEFLCSLERDFKEKTVKPFKVFLEYVTDIDDRLMLITKFNTRSKLTDDTPPRCDIVILDFNDKRIGTFAYVSTNRRGSGTWSTFVFELMSNNYYSKAFFNGIKEINVRPVMDNIRIEFGAFNAVFQLESTPLFNKIINPLELLKSKPIPTRKIKYKGFNRLNPKQEQVLLNTYAKIIDETTPNITLIKGPPGTGKTSLISNLALQSMYGEEVRCMDKKILICAQSNVAVDVIAAKLFDVQQRMRPEIRFRIIRYGLADKISPAVRPISLENIVLKDQQRHQLSQHGNISLENKENIRNDMLTLEAQIMDMTKRNIKGTVEEDVLIEKKKQLELMRSILNQTIRPEDERAIYTFHLTNANIVCATLSSCVKLSQYVNYFDICIIDEATQCTEPWTLMPLKFGINSLVLVGDTQQLPATVISKKAVDLGFCNSMFTRIQNCLESVDANTLPAGTQSNIIYSLQTQYRMHPEICRWPNFYFYKNELINGNCTLALKTPIEPFSVINLAYSQNEYCNEGKISNNQEAEFVVKLLQALDGYIPNKYNSYGVITPYLEHRKQVESNLKACGLTNIMVNTIDSYQGLEKDVIVISNARTRGIGFLSNYQRLNVALTRPKKCLILCGNFKNLEAVPSWRSLLKEARERKVYHEISAESAQDIHRNVIEKIKLKQ